MMRKKSLATNAILNTAKTVLGILFPLISFPYVSHVLGVENLGIYNFSFSFLSYFLLIAALGISTYGIREGTHYRENKVQIQSFVSELFSINMISTIVAYILLIVCLFGIPFMEPYRKAVLILSSEILFTTIGVSWVCNVYEDFLAIAVRTIAFQILSLVLLFVFVQSADDLYRYVAILVISNSGANLANFFYIRKKYCKFYFTTKIDWKKHLKPILIIFSTTIAITIYVSSGITILGFMTNDYQVGLYGTAVKIYTVIKNILAAILMVLIPRFTLVFSNDDHKQSNELFSKVFNILTVLMLPMCTGLFSLSGDIVTIISGRDYMGATDPLRLLSIAVTFSLYAYMYTQCVLIPVKEEKIVLRATIVSAVVNIILNFILIPMWSINAAAITTIIAEFIMFVMAFYYSQKTVRLVGVWKNLVSTLIGCICVFFICFFAKSIELLFLRVMVSVCCSVLGYLLVLIVLRNSVLKQLKEMLVKRQKPIPK